jgi:hypothetical protein
LLLSEHSTVTLLSPDHRRLDLNSNTNKIYAYIIIYNLNLDAMMMKFRDKNNIKRILNTVINWS